MRLGSGVNGAVYLACREKRSEDCDYVVKVQPHNQQAKAELEAADQRAKTLEADLEAAKAEGAAALTAATEAAAARC